MVELRGRVDDIRDGADIRDRAAAAASAHLEVTPVGREDARAGASNPRCCGCCTGDGCQLSTVAGDVRSCDTAVDRRPVTLS